MQSNRAMWAIGECRGIPAGDTLSARSTWYRRNHTGESTRCACGLRRKRRDMSPGNGVPISSSRTVAHRYDAGKKVPRCAFGSGATPPPKPRMARTPKPDHTCYSRRDTAYSMQHRSMDIRRKRNRTCRCRSGLNVPRCSFAGSVPTFGMVGIERTTHQMGILSHAAVWRVHGERILLLDART
jgi:hypothetical protein